MSPKYDLTDYCGGLYFFILFFIIISWIYALVDSIRGDFKKNYN